MKTIPKPATKRGEATRQKLLQAAESEFGSKGFHAASVAGITSTSGVAQGTFYIYFRSKEDLFRELVREISRNIRFTMARATLTAPDRLSAERSGLESFIAFIAERPHLYRIVQESQQVDEQVYRDYYNDIARGYTAALRQAAEDAEIAPGDAEVRAWALMGIGHFLGLRFCLWQGHKPSTETMDAVMDFVANGIARR